MEWKTWDKWIISGYYVKRGEKSTRRNEDGKCLFSSNQVSIIQHVPRKNFYKKGVSYDYENSYTPEWLPNM